MGNLKITEIVKPSTLPSYAGAAVVRWLARYPRVVGSILRSSFGGDYKPRSHLHNLVVSGTLNSNITTTPLIYTAAREN